MRGLRRAARRGPIVTTTVVTTAVTAAALAGPSLAASIGSASVSGVVSGHGIRPPQKPARNVSPSPDFLAARSCARPQPPASRP